MTPSLAASADASVPTSAFARVCQVSHLLSRVLQHGNEKAADLQFWYQEGVQLHHILDAFTAALSTELQSIVGLDEPSNTTRDMALWPAISLAYTAQIILYDVHSCAELDDITGVGIPEQLQVQTISIAGLKSVCPAVARFAGRVRTMLNHVGHVSPLVTSCMYEAAKYLSWYHRETNRTELLDEVREITDALRAIAPMWAVAGMSALPFRPTTPV